ncbi:TetR/AcrR family transcriptional regulator [Halioxenophilus sp. WMMB6]|uniref:TetR/AcrR family transcriptional regulator n=1 Tax=Halioxenophilus sp. WMMB6 TaxID=3073815 RepID=UPI00295E87BC|nr:TetR family transcriptional regulator [Halioxenophilus sp. WMMB6]
MDHIFEEPASSNSTDARMLRTRAALHRAIFELLATSTFESITIRDLTRQAGIGYATFFRHYATKETLLEAAAAAEIRQLNELTMALFDTQDCLAACLELCRYIELRRALWRLLLSGRGEQVIRDEWIRLAQNNAEVLGKQPNLEDEAAIVVSISANIGLLNWWLNQEQPLATEQIAQLLNALVMQPSLQRGFATHLQGQAAKPHSEQR